MTASNVVSRYVDLEKLCFGADAWSEANIAAQVNGEHSVCCLDEFERGYAFGACVGEDFELYRIGVLPEFRGRGCGAVILQSFHDACREHLIKCSQEKISMNISRTTFALFLEVNERNTAAINLYKRAGYAQYNRRCGYYNGDDAVLMKLTLCSKYE